MNPNLLHWQADSLLLSLQGSPEVRAENPNLEATPCSVKASSHPGSHVGWSQEEIKPCCQPQLEVVGESYHPYPAAGVIELQLISFASQRARCFSRLLFCMCEGPSTRPAVRVQYIQILGTCVINADLPGLLFWCKQLLRYAYCHMLICKSISFKGSSAGPLVLFAFLSLPPPPCYQWFLPYSSCPFHTKRLCSSKMPIPGKTKAEELLHSKGNQMHLMTLHWTPCKKKKKLKLLLSTFPIQSVRLGGDPQTTTVLCQC